MKKKKSLAGNLQIEMDFGGGDDISISSSEQPNRQAATNLASLPDKDAPSRLAETPTIFSVSELTRRVRNAIERDIGRVWVEGEVSNLRKQQGSGHQYFTLKDSIAQIACVLFARTPAVRTLELRDGLHIELAGDITVYEARGQYQMVVREGRAVGAGALAAKFEALKRKLDAEGLFATEKKRPLPRYVKRIGVVTSPTGAAIRDFLNVLHRRSPGIEVLVNPVRVQGSGAAAEIAAAVREFSDCFHGLPEVDVIVVTRGGGSIEDLWEFNEEILARAIAASRIPVVSAVGHEIDFTICDFAADYRAPTPSAAAEILAAETAEMLDHLERDMRRMTLSLSAHYRSLLGRLDAFSEVRLERETQHRLDAATQRTDLAISHLTTALLDVSRLPSKRLEHLALRLSPQFLETRTSLLASRLDHDSTRLIATTEKYRTRKKTRLDILDAKIGTLNPAATLARGFTITLNAAGQALTAPNQVQPGETITTRTSAGTIQSEVL